MEETDEIDEINVQDFVFDDGPFLTTCMIDEGSVAEEIARRADDRAFKRVIKTLEFSTQRARLCHGHPVRDLKRVKRRRVMRGRFSM